ncbi:MBL fold metallo-hydrolase [Haliovirga abyssi]|uniref:Hydroxyacylglutathione hydrolase n=1 Tax=Haliovirga abyssi TaxID=2996794 RepID=A0AAU9DH39_9FUSO|nr:MBL fold metallo-hydrolase [Haliovirga abyssi]BDU50797.1 hydroxyacylglutathione hydrolase [Haliovirga abyssi]
MKIEKFILGKFQSNCYMLTNGNEVTIIDPGSYEVENIIKYMNMNKMQLKRILLTHGHFDHIMGLKIFLNYFENVEIVIGEEEINFLENEKLNLSEMLNEKLKFDINKLNLIKVKENDEIDNFLVINTPGHTIGSKSYYFKSENIMFVGDFIFENAIGRTDFPTGNFMQLKDSIKKILIFKDELIIMSGHGRNTVLGKERKRLEKY